MYEQYWNDIPVGKENAVTYDWLCERWLCGKRAARSILHELSLFDSGDDYILIRSSSGKGFYKTDDPDEMEAFKRECLSKGRSVFAPIKKINRVLNAQGVVQYTFDNNLRVIREGAGLKQRDVCKRMSRYDKAFNVPLLSKMENGQCCPTPYQRYLLSQIYGCEASSLVVEDLY